MELKIPLPIINQSGYDQKEISEEYKPYEELKEKYKKKEARINEGRKRNVEKKIQRRIKKRSDK